MQRMVLLYPGEDGMWVAECLSLPGVVSLGATKLEAIQNVREAIDLMIETLREYGEPIPEDKHLAISY